MTRSHPSAPLPGKVFLGARQMKTLLLVCCVLVLGVGCTATGSLEKNKEITQLRSKIERMEKQLFEIETAVGKAQRVLVSHQESLERQGNVNTSLMNITETLVKKGNE